MRCSTALMVLRRPSTVPRSLAPAQEKPRRSGATGSPLWKGLKPGDRENGTTNLLKEQWFSRPRRETPRFCCFPTTVRPKGCVASYSVVEFAGSKAQMRFLERGNLDENEACTTHVGYGTRVCFKRCRCRSALPGTAPGSASLQPAASSLFQLDRILHRCPGRLCLG